MDIDEDSDLFSKTPAPLVKTAWVSIVAYKYPLKKATSHFIKQSCSRITNACRRVLGLIAFKGPQGVVLIDRMHIRYFGKSLEARKPDFGACEQQRSRPVFVSHRAVWSGPLLFTYGKYNNWTCFMQNFILPVVSVAEQTGLSLTQSETRKTGFLARWPYHLLKPERPCLDVMCMEC